MRRISFYIGGIRENLLLSKALKRADSFRKLSRSGSPCESRANSANEGPSTSSRSGSMYSGWEYKSSRA
jgi:hypothetical protein